MSIMWFIPSIKLAILLEVFLVFGQALGSNPVHGGHGEWTQDEGTVTITYITPNVDPKVFLALPTPTELHSKINDDEDVVKLPAEVLWPLEWSVSTAGEVKVRLTKKEPGNWSNLEVIADAGKKMYKADSWWAGVIKEATAVTHDSYNVKLEYKNNVFHYVPVGHHVAVKPQKDDPQAKTRAYTPLPILPDGIKVTPGSWRKTDEKINFLIKRYKVIKDEFKLSPWITSAVGSDAYISNVRGGFSNINFENKKEIYLYAAGTGITPMIGVIVWALQTTSINVKLLYFNKTPGDAIWKDKLDNLDSQYEKFSIVHIYSDKNMAGYDSLEGPKGHVTKSMMQSFMPIEKKAEQLVCMCGPPKFVEFVEDTLLIPFKYERQNYFRFQGSRSKTITTEEEYRETYKGQV